MLIFSVPFFERICKISFLDKKIEQYLKIKTYLAALEKNTILIRFQFVVTLIDLYDKIFTAFDRRF